MGSNHFRLVDVERLLEEPDPGVEWRCAGFVADATLSVLAGSAGSGKTFLAHALAAGVARGSTVAGIECKQGRALVVDAEMGQRMSIARFRVAGIGAEFDLVDALGFSLTNAEDFRELSRHIERVGANFVVLDSLRKLTPGKKEDASDDMGPIVADLTRLSRDTGAAICLIHHQGKGDAAPAYRGSTAIGDQADAVFTLTRSRTGSADLRLLSCKEKAPRYAPEPEPTWLRFAPRLGGFVEAEGPKADNELKAEILAVVADGPLGSYNKLALAVGQQPANSRA